MMRSTRNDSTTASAGSLGTDSNNNVWPLTSSEGTAQSNPNNDDAVKDRQKAVMEKLSQKKPKSKSSMFGMFKKI
jgi:hypothetical protein